jgi:hypothetical protein
MTTHYDARWPHITVRHAPTEDDAYRFPRFVVREYAFPDGWECTIVDLRYNPNDRLAAVFVYPARPKEAA